MQNQAAVEALYSATFVEEGLHSLYVIAALTGIGTAQYGT
jgi:hypothetical protein